MPGLDHALALFTLQKKFEFRMPRRVLAWSGGIALIALVSWAAFKPHAQVDAGAGKAAADKPQPVVTYVSTAENVPVSVEAQGSVVALDQVDLRPQVASTIRELHIHEGQEVKAGQLLVTLDGRADVARVEQSSAQLAQTEAQLKDAERNLARNKELLRQSFISQSAVDSAQSNVDALRASVEATKAALVSSRVSLGYQTLTAPLAGRVGAIDVHRGSLVQPTMAQPLLSITQIDPIGVRFTLPERDFAKLLKAQASGEVQVRALLGKNRTLDGKLSFVDSAVDTATGTITVKAQFPNGDRQLWPGLFTRVAVNLGVDAQAVTLPTGAVQTGPNGQFVYVVKADQTVSAQPVKLLRVITRNDKQFGIVDGLASGVRVVVEGGQNLRPGGKVQEAKP